MKRPARTTIVVSAVALACVAGLVVAGAVWATGLQSAANAGKAQAKAGIKSLAAHDATSAVSHFGAAEDSFTRAKAMLGPDWLASVAKVIPPLGHQFAVAKTLVAIGIDGSAAGKGMSSVLVDSQSSSETSGTGRIGSLLASGRTRIDEALLALSDIADRSAGLSEEGLVEPLAKAVREANDALAGIAPFLGRSRAMLTLERYLLSGERRILLVSQDSAELRPTGGFMGSYGILGIGPAGLSLEKYMDVYSLPNPPGVVTPPPGALMTPDFQFRDANWWIDFPTSARTMLGFWRGFGQPPVDAVIAVDVVAVKSLLEVSGPITVPGYKETFTSQNLLTRLVYLIEDKLADTSNRKGVLAALADELEQRVLSSGSEDLVLYARALASAADAKHVQVYFPDAGVQAAIADLGWSGAIAPPAGSTDLLAVCNAMNLGSKVNIGMRKTIDYEVALAPDGSADTTLVLGYSNTAPFVKPPHQNAIFRDYLRVYRSLGTVELPSAGSRASGSTGTIDTGLPTMVRGFTLLRGQSRQETVRNRVPDVWRTGPAPSIPRSPVPTGSSAVSSSAGGGLAHYRLFLVRQADLEDIPTTVTITAPTGWRISSVNAWKAASDQALAASSGRGVVRLALPLDSDVVLDIEMVRG
jgi:hypothetical protein